MRKFIRSLAAILVAVPMAAFAVASGTQSASAEDNGVGLTPLMGWSSWNVPGSNPTAADDEAAAVALKNSGLLAAGYNYVNQDDFWYQCPGSQGPNVDQYGRWVIDSSRFPSSGALNGIQVVANYVHSLGEKFGIYVTPGISMQAVKQNTPIEGTPYTADEIAEPSVHENNYNCGGMVGIDYSKPGAQAFINSWADEFASWGVDYLKVDGVGSFDIPDVQAWSSALRQTGQPIHLELSNSLNINDASTWEQYSNGWRTGGDVQCYCGNPYPLTRWSDVASRFDQVADWQPYGEPGAFNDYDSLVIGSGPAVEGLSYTQEQSMMSLWALAASPLVINADMTNLDPTDLSILSNPDVVSVDQDAIDASRVSDTATSQIFAKTEKTGDVAVGLFNTSGAPETITTTASALGLAPGTDYLLNNLWTHQSTETTGVISANVPSDGVALFRVSPLNNPTTAPPAATLTQGGPSAVTAGQTATFTESFTDNGDLAALRVHLGLQAPAGWTVTATSPTDFAGVDNGQTVQATFHVVAAQPSSLFETDTVTGTASYTWAKQTGQSLSAPQAVGNSPPVQAPYKTFSSATDAPAVFGQSGQQFGISGAGPDVYTGADAYSATYLPGAVGNTATIETEVTAQQNMNGFAKAGIMVRNDITGSGTTPEGVILFESPSGGIQLEWDSNGGTHIDSFTPANGAIPESLPVYLELVRNGSTYTGYYSFDGSDWLPVGSATVAGQAATQDAGMFMTSHAAGQPGQVTFNGFSVSGSAATPPPATSYEAESPANTLAGGAVLQGCSTCSGGRKVGFVGEGGTLTFNNVTAPAAGTYNLTIVYCTGNDRPGMVSVDGGAARSLSYPSTGSFTATGTLTIPVQLAAGDNTIEFGDPNAFTPDYDRIIVADSPS